jgi:hypothetical protein
MSNPLGFFGLLAIGCLGIAVGVIGLRRGKVVAIFDWERRKKPELFWYGIIFQLGLGATCLVLAVYKLFT